MKKHIFISIGLTTLFLSGCATTIPLSSTNRSTIHEIYVNPQVPSPPHIFYEGHNQLVAQSCLGIIGGLAMAHTNDNEQHQIETLAQTNHIVIGNIVSQAFTQQLQHEGFVVTNRPDADTDLLLQIKMYGFYNPNGFTDELKPALRVQAKLVRQSDHKTIWQDEDFGMFLDNVPGYNISTLANNPAMLKQAWTAAANTVALKLLQPLQQPTAANP